MDTKQYVVRSSKTGQIYTKPCPRAIADEITAILGGTVEEYTVAHLRTELYEHLKRTANQIACCNARLGNFAARKVEAISADSDLKVLIQVGEDLKVIAKRTLR